AELLFLLGLIHTDTGALAQAKAVLLRLVATEPGPHFSSTLEGLRSWKGRYQLGLVCFRLGQFADARALWQAVLRQRPDLDLARAGRAQLDARRSRGSRRYRQTPAQPILGKEPPFPGSPVPSGQPMPRLLITLGDVAGVGPEIVARAWPTLVELCR